MKVSHLPNSDQLISMVRFRVLSPYANSLAFKDCVTSVSRNAALISHVTWRELKDRYVGQALGMVWAIGAPLLAVASYVMAFTLIFGQRLGADDTGIGYTCYVLAGLVPWLALQDVLTRAPTAISGSANLVKQVVFPSEVLPLKVTLATLPTLFVGIAATLVISAWAGRLTLLGAGVLLPFAIIIFVAAAAGLALMLAAVGVFLRDIREVTFFLMSTGLLFHPILYPPASEPAWVKPIFAASPFSHLIWCFRDALVEPHIAHPWSWLVSTVVALLSLTLGWRVFRMLQPTFGNAL